MTLSAVRQLPAEVTAVVTVADDGGSSGRLRRELGLIPPGDLRMALAALTAADKDLWGTVVQHRFGGEGALAGHAVGNLLLAGLFEVLGDPVAALDELCKLLDIQGRVLPMCMEPLDLEAEVSGLGAEPAKLRRIRGQVAVASTPGRVERISLRSAGSSTGELKACPQAVDAVLSADVVLLGPGSWFSSVLVHVLVPELHDALVRTTAKKVIVMNLVPQPGETSGFSPARHLTVLAEHAPALRVETVLANRYSVDLDPDFETAVKSLGAQARVAEIAELTRDDRHDVSAVARELAAICGLG
jgi:uncharacterized cofD-like protein